jgi:hypothetical protein
VQLKGLLFGLGLAVVLVPGLGLAQSLSPMHGRGGTPSLVKGFRVKVGNPYRVRMTFELVPMDAGFGRRATNAVVTPAEVTLAPGYARPVIVAFKIPSGSKERTIGLCIMPKALAGPILPRVCGTYTGVRIAGLGG